MDKTRAPCVFASGLARVRNFAGNRYPFRAESHFLYFVGQHIEEALLCFYEGEAKLYVPQPDPDAALWDGPQPSLDELAVQLELDVLPLDSFEPPTGVATLFSADAESALWLEELLGRSEADAETERADAALAELMIELRLTHDADAIEQLRQAAAVTALAHRAGMAATRVGVREAVVRAAIEAQMTGAGMAPAYHSIVTTQGEVLHHPRSTGTLAATDLLLVDAGAETPEGWAADVTRTWPVSGRFQGLQADVYGLVLAAQDAAIARCLPGVSYREVHRTAGRVLLQGLLDLGLFRGTFQSLWERGAHALFFPHGVGHLLGLDVHDLEDLGDRAGYAAGRQRSQEPAERYLRLDRELQANMLVTIEPGFYRIPGLLAGPAFEAFRSDIDFEVLAALDAVRGIRIEDDVLVTASAPVVLTADIPKRIEELERCVGR